MLIARPPRAALFVVAARCLTGCDGHDSHPTMLDAGVPEITEDASDADGSPETSSADAAKVDVATDAGSDAGDAPAPVPNESFETARPVGDEGALIDVLHEDQHNYFTLEVEAGDTYAIHTAINDYSPDVVLSIYDAQRVLVARNDVGSLWPGDRVDARVVTRFARGGRYYVEVRDTSTPPEFFSQSGFSLNYYVLHVRKVTADTPGFATPSSSAAPVFETDASSGYRYLTLVGDLSADAPVSTRIDSAGDDALIAHVHGSGSEGNGSPCTPDTVRMETAGGLLIAETHGASESLPFYPPLHAGQHTLRARGSAGCSGGFFSLDLVLLPDNPREQVEAGNGTFGGAEPVVMKGLGYHRGLILADVAPGDVDYFSFDTLAGGYVTSSCEGESAGSGIRGLTVELRDASDRLVATATPREDGPLDIDSFPVTADGKMALRLTSSGNASPDGAEPWLRCVVITSP
jgi:hypothetical protein